MPTSLLRLVLATVFSVGLTMPAWASESTPLELHEYACLGTIYHDEQRMRELASEFIEAYLFAWFTETPALQRQLLHRSINTLCLVHPDWALSAVTQWVTKAEVDRRGKILDAAIARERQEQRLKIFDPAHLLNR